MLRPKLSSRSSFYPPSPYLHRYLYNDTVHACVCVGPIGDARLRLSGFRYTLPARHLYNDADTVVGMNDATIDTPQPTPVPLAMVVQKIPWSMRDEPRLRPMPPFEGAVLVGEFDTDGEAIAALNPEAVPMCVFVSQTADDSFGLPRELGWFVFRMLADPPVPR